jgi:hypothetical protein
MKGGIVMDYTNNKNNYDNDFEVSVLALSEILINYLSNCCVPPGVDGYWDKLLTRPHKTITTEDVTEKTVEERIKELDDDFDFGNLTIDKIVYGFQLYFKVLTQIEKNLTPRGDSMFFNNNHNYPNLLATTSNTQASFYSKANKNIRENEKYKYYVAFFNITFTIILSIFEKDVVTEHQSKHIYDLIKLFYNRIIVNQNLIFLKSNNGSKKLLKKENLYEDIDVMPVISEYKHIIIRPFPNGDGFIIRYSYFNSEDNQSIIDSFIGVICLYPEDVDPSKVEEPINAFDNTSTKKKTQIIDSKNRFSFGSCVWFEYERYQDIKGKSFTLDTFPFISCMISPSNNKFIMYLMKSLKFFIRDLSLDDFNTEYMDCNIYNLIIGISNNEFILFLCNSRTNINKINQNIYNPLYFYKEPSKTNIITCEFDDGSGKRTSTLLTYTSNGRLKYPPRHNIERSLKTCTLYNNSFNYFNYSFYNDKFYFTNPGGTTKCYINLPSEYVLPTNYNIELGLNASNKVVIRLIIPDAKMDSDKFVPNFKLIDNIKNTPVVKLDHTKFETRNYNFPDAVPRVNVKKGVFEIETPYELKTFISISISGTTTTLYKIKLDKISNISKFKYFKTNVNGIVCYEDDTILYVTANTTTDKITTTVDTSDSKPKRENIIIKPEMSTIKINSQANRFVFPYDDIRTCYQELKLYSFITIIYDIFQMLDGKFKFYKQSHSIGEMFSYFGKKMLENDVYKSFIWKYRANFSDYLRVVSTYDSPYCYSHIDGFNKNFFQTVFVDNVPFEICRNKELFEWFYMNIIDIMLQTINIGKLENHYYKNLLYGVDGIDVENFEYEKIFINDILRFNNTKPFVLPKWSRRKKTYNVMSVYISKYKNTLLKYIQYCVVIINKIHCIINANIISNKIDETLLYEYTDLHNTFFYTSTDVTRVTDEFKKITSVASHGIYCFEKIESLSYNIILFVKLLYGCIIDIIAGKTIDKSLIEGICDQIGILIINEILIKYNPNIKVNIKYETEKYKVMEHIFENICDFDKYIIDYFNDYLKSVP